MAKEQM